MLRRLLGVSVVIVAVLSCAPVNDRSVGPASVPRGTYGGGDIGESAVGAIPDVVLRDNERNRDVLLSIEYPTRGGPHPLILFSHAFGGSNRGYVGLSSYWASHGYVVIRPAHADGQPRNPDNFWEGLESTAFRNRVRDLTLILDSLESLTERYPELQGKIDVTKVGAAGHSYGAHTAMLLGGVRIFPGGVSYADPRVSAVVALSPQGPGAASGLNRESFAGLAVPALFVTGTNDGGTTELETADWRQEAFRLAPAGDKWLVVIEGASTASFSGRLDRFNEAVAREQGERSSMIDGRTPATTTPDGRVVTRADRMVLRQQEMFAIARGSALAFFDTYLKESAEGRSALEAIGQRTGATLERK